MDRCIEHKFKQCVIVYQDYLVLTEDECAAELLAAFEFWTNPVMHLPDRWIRRTIDDISNFLLKRHTREVICRAIKKLEQRGFIQRQRSRIDPHDRAYEYYFVFEVVQVAIDQWAFGLQEGGDASTLAVRASTANDSLA